MHLPIGDFGTAAAIDLDASDQYFFFGWGTSSAIGRQEVGGGSIYFTTFKDKSARYLDGAMSYKMTMPGPVPANLFWSTTVYDAETRCLIEPGFPNWLSQVGDDGNRMRFPRRLRQ